MQQPYLGPPPLSPLSRLLAGIVAVVALVGTFFFGLFILAVAVAIGVIGWAAFRLRMWWFRRQLSKSGFGPEATPGARREASRNAQARSGEVIDAEYEVVSRKEDD